MLARKRRMLPLTRPKTPRELRDMKRAIRITGRVLSELESPFGRTEKDVAKEIRGRIYSQGARLSFRPIVATGRNTRHVHHKPGKRTIMRENPLLIDLGARYRGQCSDITRMYIPSNPPFRKPGKRRKHLLDNRRIRKIYQDTLNIQKTIIRGIKPGIEFRELNELYRKMIQRRGYRMKHSIGHGLGPSIHERIGELKPGMVLTIEPGIYIDNFGGCRIEDMVLVKKRGIEILSKSIPKSPKCFGWL